MNKKHISFLISAFVISCIILFLFMHYSKFKFWDETVYANLGYNFAKYKEYSFAHGFSDFAEDLPKAGFRSPLLPLILSLFYLIFENNSFLNFLVPLIGAFGVIALFLLAKELFDEKTAVYSSLFLLFLPIYIFWSSKIIADVLETTLIIFTVYFFWLGFFKHEKKALFKVLFGLFFSLSFLSRYSALWISPALFLMLILKDKFAFLKNKGFWLSILTAFIVILPWLVYSQVTYSSPIGFLIHAKKSTLIWNRTEPWTFFFTHAFNIFSVLIPFFILGLTQLRLRLKKYAKLLVFLLFASILLFAISMPHKEERYILLSLPFFCIISSLGLKYFKKFEKVVFVLIILALITFDISLFNKVHRENNTERTICFFDSMNFISKSNASAIVTEWFSPVYFYTHKPNIRVRNNYQEMLEVANKDYPNQTVYYFYLSGDWVNLKLYLTEKPVFNCGDAEIFKLN